jgi:hypothetical protein
MPPDSEKAVAGRVYAGVFEVEVTRPSQTAPIDLAAWLRLSQQAQDRQAIRQRFCFWLAG